ncbi:MAG: MBL fold metallo-hydrolase [Saprospiraceae bacterium]
MKITVLGSGTSSGIPIIGCKCPTCTSSNPKDKRLRVSVYSETKSSDGTTVKILIDTSPDFRQQCLVNNITDIDIILFTHSHVDHIMGLDDIRQINQLNKKEVDAYGSPETLEKVRQSFNYIFDPNTYRGGGLPLINLIPIGYKKFSYKGIDIEPLEYSHGPSKVWGYRIDNFAYMTDCSAIPEETYGKLKGLDVLILDALRYRPHPTHLTIDDAVIAAKKIGAKKTYFTHMTHDLLHDEVNSKLPEGIELGYDGLVINIE